MTQGNVEKYGPYPVEDAAAQFQADNAGSVDPSADAVVGIPYGGQHVVFFVVKDT